MDGAGHNDFLLFDPINNDPESILLTFLSKPRGKRSFEMWHSSTNPNKRKGSLEKEKEIFRFYH